MVRFRPRLGIALFITLTISIIPPILMLGAWLVHHDIEEEINQFDRHAQLVALSIADGIQELISLKVEVLNVTAGTLSAIPVWEKQSLQVLLDAQIKSSQSFDSFYVGDMRGISIVFAPSIRPDGVVTRSGVNYSDREYFKLLKKSNKPSFGRIKRGKQSGVINVHIAVPIYQNLILKERGGARGYITAGLKPSLLNQVVNRILKGDDRLRIVIMEKENIVISDNSGELKPLIKLDQNVLFSDVCNPSSKSKIGVNRFGEELRSICTHINIGDQRWYLWVARTQESIESSARRSLLLTILMVSILIIIVLFVALVLSIYLGRLMKIVSINAQRIGDGHFDIQFPKLRWYSPHELVELGDLVLKTLTRLKESDQQVNNLVHDLREITQHQAPLVEAWRQVREAIEIIDDQGIILYVNPIFHQLFMQMDETQIELKLPSPLMYLTPKYSSECASMNRSTGYTESSEYETIGHEIIREAKRGQKWLGEVKIMIANRQRLHEVHSSPIMNDHGELTQIVVIHRDITDERLAQASAAHNDRLAAIGTLAAGMAHEINNPLMYIKTNVELVHEELDAFSEKSLTPNSLEDLKDALNDAGEGVLRVSTIVKNLLSIARSGGENGGHEAMRAVDLQDLVNTCTNLVKSELSKRITLEVSIPEAMSIWGRRSELIQVLLNLLINASQAMSLHQNREQKNGLIRISAHQDSSDTVLLEVSDNAGGIPPDILPRIFEPFFSSKPVNKGTGLGLSVSRGIIEAHQGSIEVTSRLHVGTTFVITLPTNQRIHQDEVLSQLKPSSLELPIVNESPMFSDASQEMIAPQETRREMKKILIVDDDLLVAKSLGKILKKEDVHIVQSGLKALECLKSRTFDVILSDVMMPALDGPSFYWHLVEDYPHYSTKVIFITGATKGDEVYQSLLATQCPVLNKPVNRFKLLNTIDTISLLPGKHS